jgi:hypothetical protein
VAGYCEYGDEPAGSGATELDIIRMMKSRSVRFSTRVANMGDMRNTFKMLIENPEGEMPFGRIILKL